MENGDPKAQPNVEIMSSSYGNPDTVNPRIHRFPHSIVWTPLPIITWLFPLIGHVGIANADGVIFDFAGPYYVGEDKMAFGWPTRYIQLDMVSVGGSEAWDRGVHDANKVYRRRVHNLFLDNCHSHVACALNHMKYRDKTNWNMFNVGLLIGFRGKFLGWRAFLKTFWLFLILLIVIITVVCLATGVSAKPDGPSVH